MSNSKTPQLWQSVVDVPHPVDDNTVELIQGGYERAFSPIELVCIELRARRRFDRHVLAEVAAERTRQDAKWGGPEHDDEHRISDWAGYIEDRLSIATKSPPVGAAICREMLVEIAALAVAAIESHDRRTGAK